MKNKFPFIVLAITLLVTGMTGCYPPSKPITYQTLDTLLTSGQLEYYGAFYEAEGVPYDVICLDLYSKGLGLNEEGMMEGVGTNLYIGDIFISTATPSAEKASSLLIDDTYESDSVAELSHFLRGLDYDGNYGGSYVLLMGESGYKVYPITEGEMTVTYIGDTLVLDGIASLKGLRQPYPFHYRDILPVIRRER
ncbi:MAG: hypothetical protein J5823_01915 [Paludibacteraceae bacterium]|nr:hypothetical protein [Paludibacteraceae bacterium]